MEILCEIITIGDEILIGQILDTNSAWMAQELNKIGVRVKQISSVSDDRQHILNSLEEAEKRADIILVTGGLGPTKDDITKKTLCEYFKTNLELDEEVLNEIKNLFKKFGREINEAQYGQAMVPSGSTVFVNKNGTAPGICFKKATKIFVSMPGVPYEMKGLMTSSVIPFIKKNYKTPVIAHKTILTQGMGESYIAELIKDWENDLPKHIKLAYLPSVGGVRLRLSAYGENENTLKEEINNQLNLVLPFIEKVVFGYEEETLEGVLGELLMHKSKTLAIAESCTGGYLSHLITSVSGSSNYLKGSIISYTNNVKISTLNVKEKDIEEFTAVSEQVATQMAKGVLEKFNTDFAIATTGIAGPLGGTEEIPVGTVYIAIASKEKVVCKKFQLGDNRKRVIERASLTAMMMLRRMVLEN